VLAMNARHTPGWWVNIACGDRISVNRAISEINRLLGTHVAPNYLPPRLGDIVHSSADISLARDLLGYQPKVTFEEGLKRTIDYYRSLG
jgi:nucleoside-diphosphate-sugar epimerase